MTKQNFIDQIYNILDSSGYGRKIHPKDVEFAINSVYNQFMWALPESAYDTYEFLTKEYTSQTVTYDSTRELYYTTLPAAIVPMKIPSEAVRHVGVNAGTDSLDFIPCTETTWELMDGLFAHDLDESVAYIVRNDKLWYGDAMTSTIADAGVRLVLAIQFEEFDSTDTINLPAGGVDLVQGVLQFLSVTAPLNLKNNNA